MRVKERIAGKGHYVITCRKADGTPRWVEPIDNLITVLGANDILNNALGGVAYTAVLRFGLKSAGAPDEDDTLAVRVNGWTEIGGANAPTYTGNRPLMSFTDPAVAGAIETDIAASCTITSDGTVNGIFITSGGTATKDTTTQTLLSVADFAIPRLVFTTDTLAVTYNLALANA